MINPHRVAELLSNLISEKLSLYDHATVNHTRDEEVAEHFYGQVESILESTHYSFQTKDTIDFNDNSNTKQFEDEEAEKEEEEEEQINNDDERFDETFMEVDEDQQDNLLLNADTINNSATHFIRKIKKLLPHYRQRNVLNTDHSDLEIEIVGNRTLSFKGEKAIFGKVRSVHNTPHSYTVQFIISLTSQPIGTCYLCLKGKNGYMFDNIKRNLFQAFNVTITCSKSGKLSSSLVKYWIEKVLEPTVGNEKVLLLLDSWSGQTDEQLYSKMKHLQLEIVPKKTTVMTQPLDITYNRQYKHIVRTIYDHVRLYDIDCNLSLRNNIIKLTPLCYSQMCSKKFIPMHRYSWFQGGYLENNSEPYQNVEEICFRFQDCLLRESI
ncbi:unnamed protein product [Rotaria sp. Silwood1]|nr:unnamed protein product [Rotaria sp. Silwood1]